MCIYKEASKSSCQRLFLFVIVLSFHFWCFLCSLFELFVAVDSTEYSSSAYVNVLMMPLYEFNKNVQRALERGREGEKGEEEWISCAASSNFSSITL